MLFAKLLFSPMPHARVRRIDLTAALAVPGVRAILTADDVPGAADTVTDLGKVIKADLRNERALTNKPMSLRRTGARGGRRQRAHRR